VKGSSDWITKGKKGQNKDRSPAKQAALLPQIDRLAIGLEWLIKTLSCSEVHELCTPVDPHHPELRISRQCVVLGLARTSQ
jgi:hypothetical protein